MGVGVNKHQLSSLAFLVGLASAMGGDEITGPRRSKPEKSNRSGADIQSRQEKNAAKRARRAAADKKSKKPLPPPPASEGG